MRARKVDLRAAAQASAAQQLAQAIDKMPRPKPRSRRTVAEEVAEMVRTQKWDQMRAAHFVELYALGHRQVYGVEAAELLGTGKASSNARKGAASAAERMLRQEFGGSALMMVRFFNWVWKREVQREQWAKENSRERGRLGWQVMIAGRAILTDYRAAQLRAVPQARAK